MVTEDALYTLLAKEMVRTFELKIFSVLTVLYVVFQPITSFLFILYCNCA